MLGLPGSATRLCRRVPPVALACLFAVACGGESAPEPEQEQPAQEPAAVTAADTATAEAALRPFLPDEMQRSTRAESFPHNAHAQISCAVCHEVPQGHGTHEDVACAQCHQASANATVVALTPAQCQSCHHSPNQTRPCVTCHESRPTVTTVQQFDLEVWDAPRSRTLSFDHGLHSGLQCSSCHKALPSLTPAEPCASCHANHHTAQAECTACHVQPAADAHDVEVHLTCSGSGCHRVPDVEAIATSRNVCLVCHRAQTDHEPGGDCIQCHRVRPESTAWADWGHP